MCPVPGTVSGTEELRKQVREQRHVQAKDSGRQGAKTDAYSYPLCTLGTPLQARQKAHNLRLNVLSRSEDTAQRVSLAALSGQVRERKKFRITVKLKAVG